MSHQTIEEEIAEVTRELTEEKQEKVSTDSAVAALTAKLAKLEALRSEIDQASEAYDKAHPALDAERQELEDYFDSEKSYLRSLISDEDVDDLAEIVEDQYDELERLVGEVANTKAGHEGSCTTWVDGAVDKKAADKQALDEAQAEADAWKSVVSTIKARFAKLNTRRADVNKAQADDKPILSYWLLIHAGIPTKAGTDVKDGTFEELLAESPEVVAPGELAGKIRMAVDELNEAEATYLDAEAQETRAKELAGEAKADLAAFKQKFEADTLEKIAGIEAAAAAHRSSETAPPEEAAPGDPANSPSYETTN